MSEDLRVAPSASVSEPAQSPPSVRKLERGEEREWDRFVLSSPYGTFFHLSGWRRVVEDVLGHSHFSLVAVREESDPDARPVVKTGYTEVVRHALHELLGKFFRGELHRE